MSERERSFSRKRAYAEAETAARSAIQEDFRISLTKVDEQGAAELQ